MVEVKNSYKLHQIDYCDKITRGYFDRWSEDDIGVLAASGVDTADRLRDIFGRYTKATTLFVVTKDDVFCGAMRLVSPTEGVSNPTVDYLKEGDWKLSQEGIQTSLARTALGVDLSKTVDILSFSIKKDYRKRSQDQPGVGYFDSGHGINVIFFQALYNWCKENNMQWITAMYATERAGPLLRSGLIQRLPDVEDKEIGGTLTTPIIGKFSVWQQIVESTTSIREGVFSNTHEIDRAEAA